MEPDPVTRFKDSMVMDFDKWHDGIGYDLEAMDAMTSTQLASIERLLLAGASPGWRDFEALEKIGTERSIEAIVQARGSLDPETRLAANRYGPPPSTLEREAAIVAGLESGNCTAVSRALDAAADCPTPGVKAALFRAARTAEPPLGYNAASTLFFLFGKIESPYDMSERPFLLRFSEPSSPDRESAFRELCARLDVDPQSAESEAH